MLGRQMVTQCPASSARSHGKGHAFQHQQRPFREANPTAIYCYLLLLLCTGVTGYFCSHRVTWKKIRLQMKAISATESRVRVRVSRRLSRGNRQESNKESNKETVS